MQTGREQLNTSPKSGEPESLSIRLPAILSSYMTPSGKLAAGNLLWLIAAAGIGQGCGLFTMLLLANSVTVAEFGIFAFAWSLHVYLYLLGSAGTRRIVVRELTRRPDDTDRIITAHLITAFFASSMIAAFTITIATLTGVGADERFLISCIALGNIAICVSMQPVLDARHRQRLVAIGTLAGDTVALLAIFVLYSREQLNVRSVGLVLAGKWGIYSLCWFFVYFYSCGIFRFRPRGTEVIRLIRHSWHLAISDLATYLPATAGVWLVRWYHGVSAAGVMGLAVFAVQAFLLLNHLMLRVVEPHISGQYGICRGFILKLSVFFCGFVSISLLIALAGLHLAVTLFLSEDYSSVVPLASTMLAGAAIISGARIMGVYFVASHREVQWTLAQIIASASFFLLAFPLTSRWSSPGAAVAFLVYAIVFALICCGLSGIRRLESRAT